jgi:hypothetical protein
MAQDLYFYKQKIISEEVAKLLSKEEVENAIKTLVTTRDLEEDTKLRENLFEEVKSIIDISAYSKGIEELLEKEEIEFIPPDSRRFMMNKKIWSVIQNIFLEKYKEIENSKKTNMTTKTKIDEQINQLLNSQAFQLLKDYSILEELFKKNLLFVNIQ